MSPVRSVTYVSGLDPQRNGGGGGILSGHPKKFSAMMVKRKSFGINRQFIENPFCQCLWEI
jgi:hypothetical protein